MAKYGSLNSFLFDLQKSSYSIFILMSQSAHLLWMKLYSASLNNIKSSKVDRFNSHVCQLSEVLHISGDSNKKHKIADFSLLSDTCDYLCNVLLSVLLYLCYLYNIYILIRFSVLFLQCDQEIRCEPGRLEEATAKSQWPSPS